MSHVVRRTLGNKSQRSSLPKSTFQVEVSKKAPALSLADFIIEDEAYEFPVEEVVPPGYYASEVKMLEPRVKGDKPILDVGYEIIDRNGKAYYIRQSYPVGSKPYRDFSKAMIAAGVKPGSGVEAAIGVLEAINLAYLSKNSDFGSIIERIPDTASKEYLEKQVANNARDADFDEDFEEEDYLEDDEL